jgi:neutral ceramidase
MSSIFAVGCGGPIRDTTPSLQAGVAAIDITPSVGDVHYRGASTGVLDPLMAKAIVFRQGKRQAALVLCDVIGISFDQSDAVRKLAAQKTGIPYKNICVAATHTHTGRFSEKAANEMVQKIGQAVVDAQAAAIPLKLQVAATEQQGLAFHRRFVMKDGSVRMNPGFLNPDIVRPAGPIDPEVGILLLRDPKDNRAIASLTNFAMHLDTVGGSEYSADYPYFLEQSLKKELGEEFISVFGTGTCGNINHFDVSKPRPQKGHQTTTKHLGETLALTVVATMTELKNASRPSLAVGRTVVQAPLQEYTDEELAWAELPDEQREPLVQERPFLQRFRASKIRSLAAMRQRWGSKLPMEIQVFRLSNDVAIVALPGEVFVELGLAIKKASPFATTFVIELANNSPAYIPTREAFSDGDYEVINSRVKPGGGEMLVDAALGLLRELKNDISY